MKRAGILAALGLFFWAAGGCNKSPTVEPKNKTEVKPGQPEGESTAAGAARPQAGDVHAQRRARMVKNDLASRDITDRAVLEAMGEVPRHEFVPEELEWRAYQDNALPIAEDQTISQPYVVALMTQLAEVGASDRVLEIGTGSGYQAAVLAEIAKKVYTIEIIEPLGVQARATLDRLGYKNIEYRIGDGYAGWPEAAPFDAVLVTAAPPRVPQPLKDQLAVGGKLIIPVGEGYQSLRVITRTKTGFEERDVASVLFVPMTGKAQEE